MKSSSNAVKKRKQTLICIDRSILGRRSSHGKYKKKKKRPNIDFSLNPPQPCQNPKHAVGTKATKFSKQNPAAAERITTILFFCMWIVRRCFRLIAATKKRPHVQLRTAEGARSGEEAGQALLASEGQALYRPRIANPGLSV